MINKITTYCTEHFFDTIVPYGLFLAALIFAVPGAVSVWGKLAFFAFGTFLFAISWTRSFDQPRIATGGSIKKLFQVLLTTAVIFFTFSRVIMFIRYGEAPLGYDTGFYLVSIDDAFQNIEGHRTVRTLLWIPFKWFGVSNVAILHSLYVLAQFLIFGALYMAARTLTTSRRLPYTAVLLFLFALSLPQFFAFWWMYYQTAFAVAFMIATIALLHRRSFLAFITAGFGAAMHPPTFFGFIIAAAVFMVLRLVYTFVRDRSLEKEVLFMASLALFAWYLARKTFSSLDPGTVYSYTYTLKSWGFLLTNYPAHLVPTFTGFYLTYDMFKLANVYLTPFAILGVVLFLFKHAYEMHGNRSPRLFFMFVFAVVLFIISYLPFIYQHRNLIYFDLALIIFAAYAIERLIFRFWRERIGRALIVAVLAGFFVYATYIVWAQPPQVFPDELSDIKSVTQAEYPGAFLLTTEGPYIPWLHAFSDLKTVGPRFHYNRWNDSAWSDFKNGDSDLARYRLLNLYDGKPILIFLGHWIDSGNPDPPKYVEFVKTSPGFTQAREHIWLYSPYSLTSQDYRMVQKREQERKQAPL